MKENGNIDITKVVIIGAVGKKGSDKTDITKVVIIEGEGSRRRSIFHSCHEMISSWRVN